MNCLSTCSPIFNLVSINKKHVNIESFLFEQRDEKDFNCRQKSEQYLRCWVLRKFVATMNWKTKWFDCPTLTNQMYRNDLEKIIRQISGAIFSSFLFGTFNLSVDRVTSPRFAALNSNSQRKRKNRTGKIFVFAVLNHQSSSLSSYSIIYSHSLALITTSVLLILE